MECRRIAYWWYFQTNALNYSQKRGSCSWLLLALEQLEKDLRQRSLVLWTQAGDSNSKFFHSSVRARQASNLIRYVKKLDKSIPEDIEDIKKRSQGVCLSSFFREWKSRASEFIAALQRKVHFRRCTGMPFHKFPVLLGQAVQVYQEMFIPFSNVGLDIWEYSWFSVL